MGRQQPARGSSKVWTSVSQRSSRKCVDQQRLYFVIVRQIAKPMIASYVFYKTNILKRGDILGQITNRCYGSGVSVTPDATQEAKVPLAAAQNASTDPPQTMGPPDASKRALSLHPSRLITANPC